MSIPENKKQEILNALRGNTKPEGVSNVEYLRAKRDSLKEGDSSSFFSRVKKDLVERQQRASEILDPMDESRSDLGKLTGASAEFAGAISNTVYEGLPKPVRNVLDKIGGGIGKGFNWLVDKISNTEFMQDAAIGLGEDSQLEKNLQVASDLGVVAGEVAGLAETGALANTFQKVTRQGIQNSIKNVANDVKTSKVKVEPNFVDDLAKDISESVSPTNFAESQFTKTFKLNNTDVRKIEELTGGQNLARFAKANNLIKGNAQDTIDAFAKFKQDNYNAVRDLVEINDENFSYSDIPDAELIVDDLIEDTSGFKSNKLKQVNSRLKDTAERFNNGTATLADVQNVKSTFDDLKSIYTRSNDLKAGLKYVDLEESVNSMRRFIEERVKEQNPNVDIAKLNNNVRVTSEFLDAAVKNSGKLDTQAIISLGDYFSFGVGQQAAPGLGLAVFGTKKLFESAPLRLRIARQFADIEGVEGTNMDEISRIVKDELNKELGIQNKKSSPKNITEENSDIQRATDNDLIVSDQ